MAVVAEAAGVGPRAEQPVQRRDLLGDHPAQPLGIVGQAVEVELRHLAGDGFVEPGGGLAGGRGQADAQGLFSFTLAFPLAFTERQRLEQGEQAHHGGGLAGAGAAGDHREARAAGQGAGGLLPVDRVRGIAPVGEEGVEDRAQAGRVRGLVVALCLAEPLIDPGVDILLVLPVAAQVEPGAGGGAGEHQRGAAGAIGDEFRLGQRRAPGVEIQRGHHPAGQRRRVLQAVALRRQREREVRGGERLGQVQADVAAAELVAGECRREQQQG